MAYEKTVWQKGMVLTAENLNKIENALEDITSVVSIESDGSGLNTINTTTNNLTVSDTSNLGTANISGATIIGTQETAADLNIYGDLTATGDVTFGTAKINNHLMRFFGTTIFNTATATLHGETTIDTICTGNIINRADNNYMRIYALGQLELEGIQGISINGNTEGTTITNDLIAADDFIVQGQIKTNEIIQRSVESNDTLKISAKKLLIDNYDSSTTSAVEIVPNVTFDNDVTITGSLTLSGNAAAATQSYVTNQISNLPEVARTGQYSALIGKPVIPTVPTNISAFTNDAGYLTTHQDISGKLDIPSYSSLNNGTYILQMTLNDGVPTYEWIPGE